jgi:1,2-phenylacetyl-CoA epoxidase catalytic subunit
MPEVQEHQGKTADYRFPDHNIQKELVSIQFLNWKLIRAFVFFPDGHELAAVRAVGAGSQAPMKSPPLATDQSHGLPFKALEFRG